MLDTPGLGNRTYLVSDGAVAVVVDPPRDIERVRELVARLGVRLTHVLETHIHNDYVTGGLALARETNSEYVVAAAESVTFERRGVADGDAIVTGALRITVVATPGHTHDHVAYVVADVGGTVAGVCTGGSLLFGTVGRTDLAGPEHTERLTRAQWRSARRLVEQVPDTAPVWPTHGFGSYCSGGGGGSGAVESTIGAEGAANPVLVRDEATFVAEFVAGLGPYPAYFRHMAPLNRSGPGPLPTGPLPPVGLSDLRDRLVAGQAVVDLRPRAEFAAAHLPGSINIEAGPWLATSVGWVVPWGTPLSLIGPDEETIAAARTALGRIGIEPVAAHVVAGGGGALAAPVNFARHPVRSFSDLAGALDAGRPLTVIDVREPEEWRDGHLPAARHIPWYEIADRLAEIPADSEVWVHCAAGSRAAIAASLLKRAGRTTVLVDDRWWQVYGAGLAVEEAVA